MASVIFNGTAEEADPGMTIEDFVRSTGRHPDAFIYLVNGIPVPMTSVIGDDVIDAIRIASGG